MFPLLKFTPNFRIPSVNEKKKKKKALYKYRQHRLQVTNNGLMQEFITVGEQQHNKTDYKFLDVLAFYSTCL